MKCIDKIKLISKAFNSSRNVNEFKVNLDLNGITIDEATKIYFSECKEVIKHLTATSWCNDDGKISWDKMFCKYNMLYALPCAFEIKSGSYVTKYTMKAINCNGNLIEMTLSVANDTVSEMLAHNLDIENEMFMTLIREINCKIYMAR